MISVQIFKIIFALLEMLRSAFPRFARCGFASNCCTGAENYRKVANIIK